MSAGPHTPPHARVQALLGPTNTGKTHRAVERMLEHGTGMLGFPLRLLAREVYDRITARLGEEEVALVTGEEKRVPRKPRYWVCTVEAMPIARAVDFVAVDEIQLVAHPERGHVFTDRLLHLRGEEETWWLGSDTAAPLLRQLVPGLRVEGQPRLSRLSHRGHSSLGGLPKRSAVVAFSARQVYETADVLRHRRGGAAVVLGALSPRARNAQVALYQSGEVDYLVATDAIGMGLNLDVDHVGLAGLSKFDGRQTRDLELAEIAQIVGRAGRYVKDGTFGTVSPSPELPPRAVQALEQHRFEPLRGAFYRNSDLDFSSPEALLQSLCVPPPMDGLRRAPEGDDMATLRHLLKRDEVKRRLTGPAQLALAWDVCRVPNYEKQLPEHHAVRLTELFAQIADHGHVQPAWFERQLRQEENAEGDIHTLMARIATTRVWSYVSQHSSWLTNPGPFRERTRQLEDRLSDALHERLMLRFVEQRHSRARPAPKKRQGGSDGRFRAQPFAALLSEHSAAEATPADSQQHQWVHALVDAGFEQFETGPRGRILFRGERVGQLKFGQSVLHPQLSLRPPPWTDGGMRARIERRLRAYVRDIPTRMLHPLSLPDDAPASAPLRGLLYQLQQGLGSIRRSEARQQLEQLEGSERDLLERMGVVVGQRFVFSEPMHDAPHAGLRWTLSGLMHSELDSLPRPQAAADWFECPAGQKAERLLLLGYAQSGPLALRCDCFEAMLAARKQQPPVSPEQLAQQLGCSVEQARAVLGGARKRRRRRAQR